MLKKPTFSALGLLVLLGAGGCLRVYGLDRESLWIDEGFTALAARLPMGSLLQLSIRYDKIPPLYTSLLHGWMGIFGDSIAAMRLFSAVLGTLCIPCIYQVAKALLGRKVALVSAFFLAFSSFHIRYSQEIRAYSLLVLLTLLSMSAFVAWLQEPRRKATLGYVLFSCFLLHTHVYGAFVVVAQNLFVFLGLRERWRQWLVCQAWLVLLFLPWTAFLLWQILDVQSHFWVPPPSARFLIDTFLEYGGGWFSSLLLLVLAAMAPRAGNRRDLLALWLLTPVLLPFGLSFLVQPIYFPRYTIPASLAFYVLAASGLERVRGGFFKILVLLCFLFAFGSAFTAGLRHPHKEQWREAVFLIESHARRGDAVLVHSGWCLDLAYNHYSYRAEIPKIPFPKGDEPLTDQEIERLPGLVQGIRRVWFVKAYGYDPGNRIAQRLLELGFLPVARRAFIGIQIELYSKGPS